MVNVLLFKKKKRHLGQCGITHGSLLSQRRACFPWKHKNPDHPAKGTTGAKKRDKGREGSDRGSRKKAPRSLDSFKGGYTRERGQDIGLPVSRQVRPHRERKRYRGTGLSTL